MSWEIGRRELLAASAAGIALAAGGRMIARDGVPQGRIALALVDETGPSGREFARVVRRAGIRTVSTADQEADLWRGARAGFGLGPGEAAVGLTGWADWSVLRPAFAEHRKLARVELRIDKSAMRDTLLSELLTAWGKGPLVRQTIGRGGGTQFAWLVA